ncbi:ribonuclease H-like protein [Aspergillus karnatakaensis]|uniref:RNA-DNA hybrid ribonuclease n=1 Tax=Aspergillus karnatakaensis TaxID=1810916 RepID=UPI003CCE4300
MVYKMQIYADGGCRYNGHPHAIGASAIIFKKRKSRWRPSHVISLLRNPPPTSQRAELSAIILALEKAIEKPNHLRNNPRLDVTIFTDSRYALGCMTVWSERWRENEWVNSRGLEVVNRDLIERAMELEGELRGLGRLRYTWIERGENARADKLCGQELNRQEKGEEED